MKTELMKFDQHQLLWFILGFVLIMSLGAKLVPNIESNIINYHILAAAIALPRFSSVPWTTCEVVTDLSKLLDTAPPIFAFGGVAQLDCPTALRYIHQTNTTTDMRAFWEGYVLERNGNHEAALQRWQKYPTELGWFFFRLPEQDRMFRLNTALSLCRYATQVDPTDSDAWQCMGEAAVQLNDWAVAEEAFKGKLEYQSDDPYTVFWLGRVYGMSGQDSEAITWLSEAIEMTCDRGSLAAFAWYELGRVLQRQGRNDDALYAFRRTQELSPNFLYIDYVKSRIATLEQ